MATGGGIWTGHQGLIRYDAQQLDNGVAGKEDLSGSKDLSKAHLFVLLWFATYYRQSTKTAQRWKAVSLQHHEQALLTRQLANTAIGWHFSYRRRCVSKQHIKGDRETALTNLVVLKCCGNELTKRVLPTLSPV